MRGILHAEDFGWSNAPRFGGASVPSTTTQNTTSQPWSGQIPYLQGAPGIPGIFPSAGNLYANQGNWPQYFPSQTYAGLTPMQSGFIGGAQNYGANLGNSGINAANSTLTSTLAPGYTSGAQQPFNATNSYLSGIIGGNTLDPFKAPGFQNVVNNTLASVIPATSAGFIGGGRADSGLATAAQTQAATNAVGGLANQNYLQEQGLQQGAANLASNNLLTQQANQIKGASVAPFVDQTQLGDLQAGLTASGMSQQDAQNLINANMARWNYNQTLPFNMLGQYQNYVGGTGYGGTTTGQSTQPYYSNTGANILSGLAGGAGILGATGAFGGSGWLAPLLGGLFASDRRLKDDVHRIGKTDSGYPLFTFRYKWEEPGSVHIGVMAQDVEKKQPEAVIHTPFGMMVDYAAVLTPANDDLAPLPWSMTA